MEPRQYPTSDPSILLLNEIDILLAQTRLMELYLKQAQATAANDAARAYQQHQAELDRLRADLVEKEQSAAKHAELVAHQQKLADQISDFEAQLIHQQRSLDDRGNELDAARAKIAQLQDALASRDQSAQHNAAALAELEKTLGGEIAKLGSELEQKQQQLEFREGEWQRGANEINTLRQRTGELEAAQQQAAAEKVEFEQTRQALENEIAELHHEIARKERELTQRFEAVSAVELALHGRIQALQQDLAGSQNELAGRDSELENACAEAESAGKRFAEETRQQFEAELSRLHDSLAQKEAALREAEAAYQNIEARFSGEIDQVRGQLEQQRNDTELGRNQLDRAQEEIAALRQRHGVLDQARQEADENWQRAGFIQSELQARLKVKNDELASVEINLTAQRQQLGDKIDELQLELAQKQLLADSRGAEIDDLKAKLNQLSAQLAEAEAARQQNTDSQYETEQSYQAHQKEIAALEENYQTRLRNLESELAQARHQADNASVENHQLAERANRLEIDLAEHSENLAAAGAESAALQTLSHSELAGLRQELEKKTGALIEQHGLALTQKNALQELEDRLSEQHHLAASRSRELQTAQAEAAALNQRVLELELGAEQAQRAATNHIEQIKQDCSAQLDALDAALEAKSAALENSRVEQANLEQSLRQELQQTSWALAQQQAAVETLAAAHRTQLQKLEAKLNQQQSGTNLRDGELEKSAAQARALQRRVEELEVELRHAEITALSRAEQMRQETAARIYALNSALQQKSAELEEHGAAQSSLDQSLRHEVNRLTHEVEERNQILQNRNDELVRVKADLVRIQDRFNQLESSTAQAATANSGDVERMRSEFQAQLALLQAELRQKESALEEHPASASGLAQQYRHQMDSLRRQLSEQKSANQQSIGESTISAAQLARLASLESTLHAPATATAHIDGEPQQRGWRSRFVAKRRWKV